MGFRAYRNCIGFGSGVLSETFCFLTCDFGVSGLVGWAGGLAGWAGLGQAGTGLVCFCFSGVGGRESGRWVGVGE